MREWPASPMAALQVMLDTSILRDDPGRRKAAFVRFEQLARQGLVTVHLSWLVQEEFISGLTERYRKALRDARAALQSVPALMLDRIGADLKQRVVALRSDVETIVRDDFTRWVSDIGVHVHPATGDHTAGMLQRYFGGRPPFRQVKERHDIPDALIWECALSVATDCGPLHFVAGDTGFEGATPNSDVRYHTSLAAFVEYAHDLLLTTPRVVNERIAGALTDQEDILRRAVAEQLPNLMLAQVITSPDLESEERDAQIVVIGDVGPILFDHEHRSGYGLEVFTVPFSASVETLLRYSLTVGRYASLDEERASGIRIAERSEQHLSAEEDAVLDVEGRVGILFEPPSEDDFDERDARQILLNALIVVEDVQVIRVRLASLE